MINKKLLMTVLFYRSSTSIPPKSIGTYLWKE